MKNLTFRYYPEVAPMITALETGEVDFTWRLPPDQLPGLQRNSDIKVESTPGYTYFFIWMNSSRQLFTDKRVRQAMAYAVDVDKIVADLLPGVAKRPRRRSRRRCSVTRRRRRTRMTLTKPSNSWPMPERQRLRAGVIWNSGLWSAGPRDLQAMIAYWNAVGVRVTAKRWSEPSGSTISQTQLGHGLPDERHHNR